VAAGLEDEIARNHALGARLLQALAGGPRAFAVAPEGSEDLARALRRKILREVADRPPGGALPTPPSHIRVPL
jgi:hypothetical protein